MYFVVFKSEILRGLRRKIRILFDTNLFNSSQTVGRYFVRYANVRFGISIERQQPVFNKNQVPVPSPILQHMSSQLTLVLWCLRIGMSSCFFSASSMAPTVLHCACFCLYFSKELP